MPRLWSGQRELSNCFHRRFPEVLGVQRPSRLLSRSRAARDHSGHASTCKKRSSRARDTRRENSWNDKETRDFEFVKAHCSKVCGVGFSVVLQAHLNMKSKHHPLDRVSRFMYRLPLPHLAASCRAACSNCDSAKHPTKFTTASCKRTNW